MTDIRSHQVATVAFERVSARNGNPCVKEYAALTHKLPGMILQNGLAQATGFLIAKGDPAHHAVLDDLLEVLRRGGSVTAQDRLAFHGVVLQADLAGTMKLTRHALDASAWMKRYVQGVLGLTATGDTVDAAQAQAAGQAGGSEEEGAP